jgi:hypothetical protein
MTSVSVASPNHLSTTTLPLSANSSATINATLQTITSLTPNNDTITGVSGSGIMTPIVAVSSMTLGGASTPTPTPTPTTVKVKLGDDIRRLMVDDFTSLRNAVIAQYNMGINPNFHYIDGMDSFIWSFGHYPPTADV